MQRQFSALARLLARVWREEEGGESLEYAFVIGLLGVGAFALIHGVGDKILDLWQRLDAALSGIG